MNIFPRRNTHLTYVFSVLLSLMLFTALKIMKDIFCKYTTSFSWCICLISPFKMIHCVMFNLSLHVKRERKIRKIYGQNIYPNFSFCILPIIIFDYISFAKLWIILLENRRYIHTSICFVS